MLWGNAIGFLLCILQQTFGIIKLPQESYYVPVVPIDLNPVNIILLNVCSLVVCFAMLIIPSFIITKVSPVKAIRFA
jgi:lipoprotein-releasing system permease protein